MTLTPSQLAAIHNGEAVPLIVDQTECVLVRKDVYEKAHQHAYDDRDWSDGELEVLAREMFEGLDRPERVP